MLLRTENLILRTTHQHLYIFLQRRINYLFWIIIITYSVLKFLFFKLKYIQWFLIRTMHSICISFLNQFELFVSELLKTKNIQLNFCYASDLLTYLWLKISSVQSHMSIECWNIFKSSVANCTLGGFRLTKQRKKVNLPIKYIHFSLDFT